MSTATRESSRRGFAISHQKVVLELDFAGSLWGFTELTIVPTSPELTTILLHCRQCVIQAVRVAGQAAEFLHHDPMANITISDPTDLHRHPELKRKVYSAIAESDEGDLSISIPRNVDLVRDPLFQASTSNSEAQQPEFQSIVVRIDYCLSEPAEGFQFVQPTEAYPHRVPHAYTTPSSPTAARCWVPCVDNFWEKSTWEFEFVVPRYLEEPDPHALDDEDGEGQPEMSPTIVVCSGELVQQVSHPHDDEKTIFLFSQAVPTTVQQIAFAAGPFHVHTIPVEPSATEDAAPASQTLMHAFCLPGHEAMLTASVSFLRTGMTFYTSEFGSYPFGSYKLVFVEEMPTQRFDSSTLSLLTVDLLHGDDAIEHALETRHALAHALASQWVGINIQPRTWSDLWLVNGLCLYITGLFMRKLLGNNEYRFRLKKDMQRVVSWDSGNMPPICQPQIMDPPDASTLPFINLKSPLVLHILDRRLGKSGTSLGLSRVLPKIFLSAISGEMPNNALSTSNFLRTCRKVSGVDPRSFAEQWIYGSGCPAFGFAATFNRKKMAVEITMRQEQPADRALDSDPRLKAIRKPAPFFQGTMTIRIHEADGTPYEHVLDITESFKRYEVPFNTKYKRVRRNTKRYLARQAAAQAAAEGDIDAAEAMGMVDMGFGLAVWEEEKERENWKVADWTEEDEQTMSGATYEWIRMDADFEWMAAIAFDQPDFMWVSQLQRDRDVIAQLEAIHALARMPTAIVSSTLTKTVLVGNYYFRIRCEAALALVQCAIRKVDFLGLFHLFKLFLRYCYDPDDPNQDLFAHTYIPKPNDFTDISEYFVRKALINAISRIRFENGVSPSIVRQFFIDQLRYNDNTANPYSDGFYICTLISAAACASVSTVPPERGELKQAEAKNEISAEDAQILQDTLSEVDRYRSMDRLIPSPHNVVTVASLEFYLILMLANHIPSHPRVFFPLTREGNYTQVRIAAFDGLFLTKWYSPMIMRYVLSVIASDPCRIVRRHVARNACQSLALLANMGEMKTSTKDPGSLLIEEDGTIPAQARQAKQADMDALIKLLRKDKEIGKNEFLREFLMNIALDPNADHEVRWCVLKLADMVIRGDQETAPKLVISLPPPPPPPPAPVEALSPPTTVKKVLLSLGPKTPVATDPPPRPKVNLKLPANGLKVDTSGTPPPKAPGLRLLPPSARTPHPLSAPPATPPVASTSRIQLPPAPRPIPEPTAHPAHPSAKMKLPKLKIPKPEKPQRHEQPARPEKPEKARKPAPMGSNDLKACKTALSKLLKHKSVSFFLKAVDPVRDGAPNYFDIVKVPMDMTTIQYKLNSGNYRDRASFEADVRLVVSNCKLYNLEGSYVYIQAETLEKFFSSLWSKIIKTLSANDDKVARRVEEAIKAAPPPTPPPPPRPAAPPAVTVRLIAARPKAATRITIPLKAASSMPKITIRAPNPSNSSASPAPVRRPTPSHIQPNPAPRPSRPPAEPTPPPRKVLPPIPPFPKEEVQIASVPPPSRPKITLKLPAKAPEPKAKTPPPPKPKALPPRIIDEPPPAYVDDGSHDILQEVIAIEAEKTEKMNRQRSIPERPIARAIEEPPSSKPSSKRRKIADDDSTSSSSTTATPVRRERPREYPVAGPSTLPPLKGERPVSVPVTPRATPKPIPVPKKKERPVEARPVEPRPAPPPARLVQTRAVEAPPSRPQTPRVSSIKGKEREIIPSSSSQTTTADLPFNAKQCAALLKRVKGWPSVGIFLFPVDPKRDGCPTYFQEILHPMDLETMETKLKRGEYTVMEHFADDIELIVHNCHAFNGANSELGAIATGIRQRFREEWNKLKEVPKPANPKLTATDKKSLQGLMTTLSKDPGMFVFWNPVDPIALGIPTYFQVISRNDARDLLTIRQSLDRDLYKSVEEWHADIELMFANAITFNRADSDVGKMTIQCRKIVQGMVDTKFASRKRKDQDRSSSQPFKKAKHA